MCTLTYFVRYIWSLELYFANKQALWFCKSHVWKKMWLRLKGAEFELRRWPSLRIFCLLPTQLRFNLIWRRRVNDWPLDNIFIQITFCTFLDSKCYLLPFWFEKWAFIWSTIQCLHFRYASLKFHIFERKTRTYVWLYKFFAL